VKFSQFVQLIAIGLQARIPMHMTGFPGMGKTEFTKSLETGFARAGVKCKVFILVGSIREAQDFGGSPSRLRWRATAADGVGARRQVAGRRGSPGRDLPRRADGPCRLIIGERPLKFVVSTTSVRKQKTEDRRQQLNADF
jgi:hypothetical protein